MATSARGTRRHHGAGAEVTSRNQGAVAAAGTIVQVPRARPDDGSTVPSSVTSPKAAKLTSARACSGNAARHAEAWPAAAATQAVEAQLRASNRGSSK